MVSFSGGPRSSGDRDSGRDLDSDSRADRAFEILFWVICVGLCAFGVLGLLLTSVQDGIG